MTIQELQDKEVKISKASITAKNNGKTCGVVRNVYRLSVLQPSKQFDVVQQLKKNGINGMQAGLNNILIDGKEIYYIVEKGTKQEFCELFAKAGYTVVECSMLS